MINTIWPQFTKTREQNLNLCCMHSFIFEPHEIVQVTIYSKINQCNFSKLEGKVYFSSILYVVSKLI